jgi:hypothetical protein
LRQADIERRQSNLKAPDSALPLGFRRHTTGGSSSSGPSQGKGKAAESQASASQSSPAVPSSGRTPHPSQGKGKGPAGGSSRPGSPSGRGSPKRRERQDRTQILVCYHPQCYGHYRLQNCPKAPPGFVPTPAQKKAAQDLRDAKMEQSQATRRVHAVIAALSSASASDTASTSLGSAQGSVL